METEQTKRPSGAAGPAEAWTLTVAHHAVPACIGRRVALDGEVPITLGRELAMLENDTRLSRLHATVRLVDDAPVIVDEASRNGTFVDGVRVSRAVLREGSIISVGGVVLIAHHHRCFFDLPSNPRVIAVSLAMSEVLGDLARAAQQSNGVLLVGETGVGKGLLAEELHVASGRDGPFVALHCGAIADEGLHAQLFGEGSRAGLLEGADGGTLFLDGVDDARPALQSALLSVLERYEVRRVGDATTRHLDVRVVASARRWPGELRDDFVARLGQWIIEIPPLRSRREDIGAIAGRLVSELGATLHHELASQLLRHDWPGNVRELEGILARAAAEQTTELRDTKRLAAMLAQQKSLDEPHPQPLVPADGYLIARNGSYFEAPGIGRVSLESRKVLQLLLQALTESAGAILTVPQLVAAGWPGERVLPRAGASRVYVSITTLRKMGLRDALERTPKGYRVHPSARII